jgi:alkylresorcinol/alkylpyrone synthase
MWGNLHAAPVRVGELHRAARVSGRYLALPIEEYEHMGSFQKSNDVWIRVGLELGEAAIREALEQAGLVPTDIDHIFFVTVTGIAVPSLDARLVNRLGLRSDIKRTPLFGLGCVAGAAGLARAADYLRAWPEQVAVLVCVELCSLTVQRDDASVANLVGSGLFGDGAAAVVMGGAERARSPQILATRSVFYPNTERIMGWDVVDTGFKIVLSGGVPDLVLQHVGRDVDAFLASQGLSRAQVKHVIAHTGGPKVLLAMAKALSLPAGALQRSWDSLEKVGNLSSASVLFVLRELLDSGEARPGDFGLLLALGPGFCSELVLLRW